MSERDIEYLLDLYENPYVKGEQRSSTTKNKINIETKRKNRHLLLDELELELVNEVLTDADLTMKLTGDQKKLVRYLIDDFNNDFQNLHRHASTECIILAFIFLVKKLETPRVRITDYRVTGKYGLTDQVFENILCRLTLKCLERTPILPRETGSDNHDILIREGRR